MDLGRILETEDKYGLIDKNIDGYPFWMLFRFLIMQRIYETKESVDCHHHLKPAGFSGKLKVFCRRLHTLLCGRYYPKKQADYLFVSGGRRVMVNGVYENTITDRLMDRYPSSLLFEFSVGGVHFAPTATRHVYYSDRYGLFSEGSAAIAAAFKTPRYRRVLRSVREELKDALNEMCESSSVSIVWDDLYASMAQYYFVYRSLKKNYERFLNVIRPKALFVVCNYERQNMIFTELAKKAGIPVIELQHGSCGTEHPAYNFYRERDIAQYPDYFLTFAPFWNEQASFPIPASHRIAVGSPYSESRTKELKESVDPEEPPMILFLSQMGRGEKLSEVAAKLYGLIDRNAYSILYKMHPGEYTGWENRYPELHRAGVPVADNTKTDLYRLFAQASCVVTTGNTTSLYEALQFGMPCFVYLGNAMAEFRKLCETGITQGFETADELYGLILSRRQAKDTPSFWENGALRKMQDAIATILSSAKREDQTE